MTNDRRAGSGFEFSKGMMVAAVCVVALLWLLGTIKYITSLRSLTEAQTGKQICDRLTDGATGPPPHLTSLRRAGCTGGVPTKSWGGNPVGSLVGETSGERSWSSHAKGSDANGNPLISGAK